MEELGALGIGQQIEGGGQQPLLKLDIRGFDLTKLGSSSVFTDLMSDIYGSGELNCLTYFGIVNCNLQGYVGNLVIENEKDSFFQPLLASCPCLSELNICYNEFSFEYLKLVLTDLLSGFQPALFKSKHLLINFRAAHSASKWPVQPQNYDMLESLLSQYSQIKAHRLDRVRDRITIWPQEGTRPTVP